MLTPYYGPPEASDSDTSTPAKPSPAAAPKAAINVRKGKWDGEDEEDDGPVVSILSPSPDHLYIRLTAESLFADQSDWEQSSEEEEEQPKPAAPIKKKGTIKAKIAEKEAAMTARKAAGEETDDDDEYDSDAVLDPRERARMDKERELNADLDNAASLLGAAALGGAFPSYSKYKFDYSSRSVFDI